MSILSQENGYEEPKKKKGKLSVKFNLNRYKLKTSSKELAADLHEVLAAEEKSVHASWLICLMTRSLVDENLKPLRRIMPADERVPMQELRKLLDDSLRFVDDVLSKLTPDTKGFEEVRHYRENIASRKISFRISHSKKSAAERLRLGRMHREASFKELSHL